MWKTCIGVVLGAYAVFAAETCYASGAAKSLVMIVDPRARVDWLSEHPDRIDEQVDRYIVRFPKALYDCLVADDCIVLKTQFDELLRLKERLAATGYKEFISGITQQVDYSPDAYLFASFQKEVDKVVLRTEILNPSEVSLAVAKAKIRFSDFLNDDIVQREIDELCNSLVKKLCRGKFGWISL